MWHFVLTVPDGCADSTGQRLNQNFLLLVRMKAQNENSVNSKFINRFWLSVDKESNIGHLISYHHFPPNAFSVLSHHTEQKNRPHPPQYIIELETSRVQKGNISEMLCGCDLLKNKNKAVGVRMKWYLTTLHSDTHRVDVSPQRT